MTRARSLRGAAVAFAVLLLLLICCLSGCSERAQDALAYSGAALLGAAAFLLIVLCLSGFEIRRGGR